MLRSVENAGPPHVGAARGAPLALLPPGEPARGVAEAGPAQDPAGGCSEAEAWAEVRAAWHDERRHRAYLARFTDLEGLAAAGRRYRDALLARPGDAVAERQRDEILRRALALGLASLPRSRTGERRSRAARRAAALALLGGLAAAALLALRSAGLHLGAVP